ncbi:hypothetical protein HDU78_000163 [Chytriomyces hyalinus]|nr:hypothetical protein HDU78_000163 [Chytriomyces hyalinus]
MSKSKDNHHRRYDPTRRQPLPTNDPDFVALMDDMTNGLFTKKELDAEPWLAEYIGEVLSRWGRWAARQRPPHLCFEAATLSGMQFLEHYGHPSSERTERIERALAEAIAGSTVDELEPNATEAMREKAVLLMADEYLGKSATPALASDARKRAKNRRSKTLVKDKNDKRESSQFLASDIPKASPYVNSASNTAAALNKPGQAVQNSANPSNSAVNMLSREGSTGRAGSLNASPRMRSRSTNREAVNRKASSPSLPSSSRRKPSNEASAAGSSSALSSDRLYERRGSSSSADDYSETSNSRYPPSQSGRYNDAYSSNPAPGGRSAAGSSRDDYFGASGSARGANNSRFNEYSGGSAGASPNLASRKQSVDTGRNPAYSEYNQQQQQQQQDLRMGGGSGGGSNSGAYRRKKSGDLIDGSAAYPASYDDRDYGDSGRQMSSKGDGRYPQQQMQMQSGGVRPLYQQQIPVMQQQQQRYYDQGGIVQPQIPIPPQQMMPGYGGSPYMFPQPMYAQPGMLMYNGQPMMGPPPPMQQVPLQQQQQQQQRYYEQQQQQMIGMSREGSQQGYRYNYNDPQAQQQQQGRYPQQGQQQPVQGSGSAVLGRSSSRKN